jgi:hypothetical protein
LLNSACNDEDLGVNDIGRNCCSQPPSGTVGLEYVSIEQSCTLSSGETPCTSTEAIYDDDGNCIAPEKICSPNFEEFSEEEKCAGKKYLTVTTIDRSGGGTHGRTQIEEYDGTTLKTRCEGSFTTTSTYIKYPEDLIGCSGSETVTITYNEDCSTTTECSGSIEAVLGGGLCCSSQANTDCSYVSEIYSCEEEKTGIPNFDGSCTNFGCGPESINYSPSIECKISVNYTDENTGDCFPKQIPFYPAFVPDYFNCTIEGEPPEPPELEDGQDRGSTEDTAYKFTNPYNPASRLEKRIKYRIAHGPTGTCYLKVWFRKVILQYKWEDCETGFEGNPPRTPAFDVDCGENPCTTRWSTDGDPIVEEDGEYTWEGSGYPCFNDETKRFDNCDNVIYGLGKEVIAGDNQEVVVEIKYSFVRDYEPNWPDENGASRIDGVGGCQGCKPNGFPIPNPADCPICE